MCINFCKIISTVSAIKNKRLSVMCHMKCVFSAWNCYS